MDTNAAKGNFYEDSIRQNILSIPIKIYTNAFTLAISPLPLSDERYPTFLCNTLVFLFTTVAVFLGRPLPRLTVGGGGSAVGVSAASRAARLR